MSSTPDVSPHRTRWAERTESMLQDLDGRFYPIRFASAPSSHVVRGHLNQKLPSHLWVTPVHTWDIENHMVHGLLWTLHLN